ncbi:hypothetical protein F4813DRAFT_393017 [Daldinia decipiens]|uniref:uncharacterized protein n=1 Tax=Daldinia decipiens TaxID=326647 RepID=UPI0020C57097|nr:uncharacterized protein F4813DRAFT_393017 [Daldinia decipiens]KAI1654071.1 hypothetical protein F4813DRAFT_393017 [Daldinia decipiens]
MVQTAGDKDAFRSTHYLGILPWYYWWLRTQVYQQPIQLYACVRGFVDESEDIPFNEIKSIYLKVSEIVTNNAALSIDDIVQQLSEVGSIIVSEDRQLRSATDLIFSIIGWQTMLYRPDILSCPPSEFCITDEMNGHRSSCHLCLKQFRVCKSKGLSEFLLGFGLMLIPRNYNTLEDAEEAKAFNRLKSVKSSTLNAYLLTTIGGITISWSDCLACHLELDKNARVLYVFRYPSFCVESLGGQSARGSGRSTIHSCTSDFPNNNHWATPQDVTELLREVLISYRLLFGQERKSRKAFRKLRPFEHIPKNSHDRFLLEVCGKKRLDLLSGVKERDSYELARDFPHLRAQLVALSMYLDDRKPRSWKELWLDTRDSASWLTFWAVIIIGGLGLILAFLQVVLQITQLAIDLRQAGS